MTVHNSRKASNNRHECNNRSANTVWTTAIAGMLAKVVKLTTAHREANYNRDTVKIRDDRSSRDNRNIMDDSSIRIAKTDSRKVSNNREDSNIQQGHQQH
jgi:hypothetical protein